jgi:hypothetical protein
MKDWKDWGALALGAFIMGGLAFYFLLALITHAQR